MIIKTITDQYYFWNWLKKSDDYKNNFSLEGSIALFEYLEQVSDDTDSNTEFDPVAWCVEYSEYETAYEAAKDYGYEEVVDLEEHGSVDLVEVQQLEKQAREWLEDRTSVIEAENGHIIVEQF